MKEFDSCTCRICNDSFGAYWCYYDEKYLEVDFCYTCCRREIVGTKENPIWRINLNKYQRDNLLWLLLQIWRGDYNELNTGDWVGEIPWLLRKLDQHGMPVLDETDSPNVPLPEPKEKA